VTVRVRLFAVLRDRAGVSELALELSRGATVAEAKVPLLERLPSLRDHLERCRFAVNLNYVRADATLHDGDELALIPPVSGG
jgi:molybdopterin converting factor subunit 1